MAHREKNPAVAPAADVDAPSACGAPGPAPHPREKIRALLLEGIHHAGVERITGAGFTVEAHRRAFDEAELGAEIGGVSVLGIRSKTRLSPEIISKARRLLAIGTFCIGTDQVDLHAATRAGIAVFNAPFSNTRSVAELVVADVIMLLRRLADKSRLAHDGVWDKDAAGCVEVRGKTLGIIGYGHIGSQVSILAEALGMRVIFHDLVEKLAIGNAARVPSLKALLSQADVVTLHVPDTALTRGMIGPRELRWMRRGTFLINTSRGAVVDAQALARAIAGHHLAGAAVDVFPEEPASDKERLVSPLQHLPNVVLTPHIGGATVEAQRNIGVEVAVKLARYVNNGSTEGAVNFPNVVLPELEGAHRILHIHRNVPGVMQKVNAIFGRNRVNIEAQYLRTHGEIGYLIMDTCRKPTREMVERMRALPETVKVRAIF